jgi:energy-coupling factor transport system ATP-binding protein
MLSGGERKRVALASVLAWDPKIVILDEPTIGQDNQQKERLRQFIVQLNRQGKTVIIVTHDIEFVAECKPRVVLMAQGKILAQGEAEKILTNYELVNQASVVLPQIAQLFTNLKGKGVPTEVIDVYEAAKILLRRLGEPA